MRIRAAFLTLLGCIPSIVTPARAQNAAKPPTVYFYRLRESYGAFLKPSVFADKAQVARMRNGRFLLTTLEPGSHTITSTFTGNGLIVEMKPGETYYFRVELTRPTMLHNARGEVTLVTPEQGKFEVAQLKPAEAEDLKVDSDESKK